MMKKVNTAASTHPNSSEITEAQAAPSAPIFGIPHQPSTNPASKIIFKVAVTAAIIKMGVVRAVPM